MRTAHFPFFFHLLHAFERLFVRFSLHAEREPIPSFQELSPEQRAITQDDKWKTYVLYAYGARANRNCRECPQTAAAVERIPGMKTAFFSILSAGKHIPSHRGPYKGLLRCHLGLVVPAPAACRMRVGTREARWQEGRALVFDDTFHHEVWNDSAEERVVLFIDFVRPMRFPLGAINDAILRLIVRSPYGRRTMRRFADWYALHGIHADV
jgi:aspartyl/asparaginyl beta-hydroxylase (cupin superfamily)